MATPDEAIVHAIRGILGQVNLDTFTLKEVRERLENQFGEDVVEDRSDFIHSTVESVVADLIAGEDEGMDDGREDVGNAYTRPLALSPDLASFLGTDRAKRSDVVKHIWRYIREQGLMKQGPNYILDARLQALFNRKTISFTTMMKALSPHMKDPTQLVGHDEAGQFVGKNPAMDDKRVIRNEAGEIQMVRRRRSGLTRPYHLTPELANVVGKDVMGRTGVVKAIWQYVKSRNLQDPNDRRQIICDDALRAVCDGESAVSGFGINKYISRHLLRPAAIPPGEEEEYVSVPTKKRRKRKEREEKKKKSVKRRQTGTSGLTKPYRLSKTLAAVVGKDIMSRVDVVRAIWAYVKDNQLQDPADKRTIVCDEKLKAVVDGNDTVTGFTINKFLSQHMLEPIAPPAPPAQMEPAGGAGGHHHHHHHHHHMHHGMPEDEEDVEDEDAYDDIGGYR